MRRLVRRLLRPDDGYVGPIEIPPYIDHFIIRGEQRVFENEASALELIEKMLESAGPIECGLVSHIDPGRKIDITIPYEFVFECAHRDMYPLPSTSDREWYCGADHFGFWKFGLFDWVVAERISRRFGLDLRSRDEVFELGCATGRVLRHFAVQRPDLVSWGCDINSRHVDWMQRFLPPGVRSFQNTVLPHLPLKDDSIALAMAYSIFTHLDILDDAWLFELRRILRPGGIALITLMTEKTWKEVRPGGKASHLVGKYAGNSAEGCSIDDPELFQKDMPSDKVIFRSPSVVYNTDVFRTQKYVKERWCKGFEILDILTPDDEHFGCQDMVFLRKV